jgi:hypothetical protein
VQEWEQHRRQPDTPARVLLSMIEADPVAVEKLIALAAVAYLKTRLTQLAAILVLRDRSTCLTRIRLSNELFPRQRSSRLLWTSGNRGAEPSHR